MNSQTAAALARVTRLERWLLDVLLSKRVDTRVRLSIGPDMLPQLE